MIPLSEIIVQLFSLLLSSRLGNGKKQWYVGGLGITNLKGTPCKTRKQKNQFFPRGMSKTSTVYDQNNGDQYNEFDQNNGQKGYDDHLYVVINGILTNQYNGKAFGDFFQHSWSFISSERKTLSFKGQIPLSLPPLGLLQDSGRPTKL